MAARLRRMPPASTSMCTASAMSDTLPVRTASASSTTRKPPTSASAARSRPLWREPWECRCTGRSAGEGGWKHEPSLALSHALALEEALARLQREAEVAPGPVERGGAGFHAQDGEDAPVALDEGDVQRGGHVLHVELGGDLPAEVEEDEAPLDLLGRGALESRRLLLGGGGDADAQGDAAPPHLERDHLHGHGREGLPPALARVLRVR